jgi:energy-coupling factor transport system ATP-binding protein
MNADVLIFDEPTMGQDALGIGRLHPIMDRLSETGRTVIVISHDMEFVAEHFDRMLVLSEGSLISDGSVRDIFLIRADVLTESGLRRPATLRICQRLGISPPPLRFAEAVTSLRSLIS